MQRKLNVAIVGATGIVGETLLDILEERNFPVEQLFLLASKESEGKTLEFKDEPIHVTDVADFDFSQVELALFAADMETAARYAPSAADQGALVIDNSMQFRYEADVPLIIPEVNPQDLVHCQSRRIIANPNCSTIQMLVALKPIYDLAGISRINVSTYQSVSGAGKLAMEELLDQTSAFLNSQSVIAKQFPVQIAFNVIPQIDQWMDNGYTREEMKMVVESQKILADQTVLINPTAVRVPVFVGHSMAINVELKEQVEWEELTNALKTAAGVILMESDAYPTPAAEANAEDAVYIGRLRRDISQPNAINLWLVADNLRKGAALNAIQIAELYLEQYSSLVQS